MDNRPIGIFDSGLGGLTGLKALRRFLPEENIVYFADSGRVPYGEKTRVQLRGMARQNLSFLSGFGVKAILIACGTLSSTAGDCPGSQIYCAPKWRLSQPRPVFRAEPTSVRWKQPAPGAGFSAFPARISSR